MSALDIQIGGGHYRQGGIQPVQYIEANKLAFLEGCVVKRVTRHDKPTGKGRQDIEKAIHELQLLLELRYPLAPDRADLGDFGQQNMIEPASEIDCDSRTITEWPADDSRMDVIGQNGNDGEHYEPVPADACVCADMGDQCCIVLSK